MFLQQSYLIRAELMRHGLNMADVARRCNVHRSTVVRVITGQARSRRIERHIGKLLGLHPGVIFPMRTTATRLQRRRELRETA